MISAMEARRLILMGCTGYHANVMDMSREMYYQPINVPVIGDFPDVFP